MNACMVFPVAKVNNSVKESEGGYGEAEDVDSNQIMWEKS